MKPQKQSQRPAKPKLPQTDYPGGASLEALERMNDRVSEESFEAANAEEHIEDDLENYPEDVKFRSELDYDGYRDIEEYDNEAYGADVGGKGDPEKNLVLDDREEELNDGEESLVDRQENRRNA